jgi:hypothetical protein
MNNPSTRHFKFSGGCSVHTPASPCKKHTVRSEAQVRLMFPQSIKLLLTKIVLYAFVEYVFRLISRLVKKLISYSSAEWEQSGLKKLRNMYLP